MDNKADMGYLFDIYTDTTFINVTASNYDEAINIIEGVLNIPKQFTKNYHLEKVTVLISGQLLNQVKLQELKNAND